MSATEAWDQPPRLSISANARPRRCTTYIVTRQLTVRMAERLEVASVSLRTCVAGGFRGQASLHLASHAQRNDFQEAENAYLASEVLMSVPFDSYFSLWRLKRS